MRDALAYLPSGRVVQFRKGQSVYDATQGPNRLYLVLSGRVRIDRLTPRGAPTLLNIAQTDAFFGATSLIQEPAVPESAITMAETRLMSWSPEEIEALIEDRPQLGIALCDYFAGRNAVLRERLTVISEFHTDVRIMVALVQLATRYGQPRGDGARCVSKLTHHTIAAYVGTSREIVTGQLNQLRRLGYVQYSRLHTDVYVEALTEWMRQQGVPYCSRLQANDELLAKRVGRETASQNA